MLIVALVLAVIGLAALVTAVVTSNELIAWVCIGASVIGVLLLIVDALRERSRGADEETVENLDDRDDETTVMPAISHSEAAEDYPEEPSEHVAEERFEHVAAEPAGHVAEEPAGHGAEVPAEHGAENETSVVAVESEDLAATPNATSPADP